LDTHAAEWSHLPSKEFPKRISAYLLSFAIPNRFGSMITIEGKEICSNFSATSHTVYLYGKLAMVTAPHFNCTVIPRGIVIDGKRDVALVAGCPKSNPALDISNYTKPALGDNVISFGYGKFAQVWTGVRQFSAWNK
jgi:hypothetical protein